MKQALAGLQSIGRALMLPIAVLPVAGLLLRLGQPDLLDMAAMAAAGDAIFSNLGLLFAIGIAVGLARENHGAAGLASVVGYLVATKGAEVLLSVPAHVSADLTGQARDLASAAFRAKELSKLSIPAGLLSGVIAGLLYNRFSNIQLPAYLAFFGGRRFVPIASGFAGLLLALCFGYGWPTLEHGMDSTSQVVLAAGPLGQFAYGVLNRVLIITGLHHILNNMAWFLLGDYNGVTGDLKRFFAGDPAAGAYMSGFFPVMMFGLPAACLAMYRTALPERRKAVGGMLLSMALTSFLTGVTEPIEFSFMFLAPVLYAVHAVLTGVAMALMYALGIHLGFGFSAGLFDYLLNFSLAQRPLWLLPIGLLYSALYYGLFRYFIVRFNLSTPGREANAAEVPAAAVSEDSASQRWIGALGGAANLTAVEACTTRLRLIVVDQQRVNVAVLKQLGARGVIRPSANALQVVVGPQADQVASDIRAQLRMSGDNVSSNDIAAPVVSQRVVATHSVHVETQGVLAALGGAANIGELVLASSRLCLRLRDTGKLDAEGAQRAGCRAIARVGADAVHLLIGPAAAGLYADLNSALASAR